MKNVTGLCIQSVDLFWLYNHSHNISLSCSIFMFFNLIFWSLYYRNSLPWLFFEAISNGIVFLNISSISLLKINFLCWFCICLFWWKYWSVYMFSCWTLEGILCKQLHFLLIGIILLLPFLFVSFVSFISFSLLIWLIFHTLYLIKVETAYVVPGNAFRFFNIS